MTEGDHAIRTALARGFGSQSGKSDPFHVSVWTRGPRVVNVVPKNFGTAPGVKQLIVTFSRENPLHKQAAETKENYAFYPGNDLSAPTYPGEARFDPPSNSVALIFSGGIPANTYKLVIAGSKDTASRSKAELIKPMPELETDMEIFWKSKESRERITARN